MASASWARAGTIQGICKQIDRHRDQLLAFLKDKRRVTGRKKWHFDKGEGGLPNFFGVLQYKSFFYYM